MRLTRPRATQPTRAERVRSILTVAHSMTVISDGLHTEVRRLDGATAMGHIHLHAPDDGGHAPSAERVPARLEFTDIAPTPVRDRLRARVTVTGLLAAPYSTGTEQSTCMEFGQAVLEDAEGRTFVTLEELEEVETDPIAAAEAGMLTHLVDDHAELVPLLLRLVHPRPIADDAGRAPGDGPLRRHPAARIPARPRGRAAAVPRPVTEIDQAGPQIHALLAAARRVSHRNGLPA